MNIRGVIVAAGYGSRFFPVTKSVPKELLPIVTRPALDFIVEEFVQAGIEDILVITSRRKKALEDYLDREIELELKFPSKRDQIDPPKARFHFLRQSEMKGTGHALLLTQSFMGDNPFVVAYPDDVVLSPYPLAAQLIDGYRKTGLSQLATIDLGDRDVSRYGVIEPIEDEGITRVRRIVEKPEQGKEPSSHICIGRYLFTAELFEHLQRGWQQHRQGEFYHIGAINQLASQGKVAALEVQGLRLDTGDPMGYLEANLRYALTQERWRGPTLAMMAKITSELGLP